jgi:hypothetical protein
MDIVNKLIHRSKDWLDTLGKAPDSEAPSLGELRLAILDEVKAKIQFLGGGRHVFPYELIRVGIRTADEGQRLLAGQTYAKEGQLERDIRTALRREACEFSEQLRVAVEVAEAAPEETYDFSVQFSGPWAPAPAGFRPLQAGPPAPAVGVALSIRPISGEANVSEYALRPGVTNIGRMEEVWDESGTGMRLNHIAFTDLRNGKNETVSRWHAHIVCNPDGECRLHDSGSGSNTFIIRGGRSLPVVHGGRGERLFPGDLVQLGEVRLSIEEAGSPVRNQQGQQTTRD